MDTLRLFTAIRLPETLRRSIGTACRSGSDRSLFSGWTHPEDYHITLQFLGDTAAATVPALNRALETAAAQTAPFRLRLTGTGTFGRPETPRVFWAGVDGELDRLSELYRAILSATGPLGFRAEDRPYSPHVTLARKFRGETDRPQRLQGVRQAVERALDESGDGWKVECCTLLATRMKASPMYETMAEFPLSSPN